MKRLKIDPERCTGCKQCELACAWVQSSSLRPSRSLIRVHIFDELASFAPYTCMQCDEAWCMNACPVNAIGVDEHTGAKVVDERLCIGCHLCALVCPFGTVFLKTHDEKVSKCHLCGGEPACALVCPTQAIEFGETDRAGRWLADWGEQVQEQFEKTTAAVKE